jgi:hypothetical protein
LQLAGFTVTVIFIAGQVLLLILWISAESKQRQDRYLEFMYQWPYLLVAPVVILKRCVLPDRYFSRSAQRDSGSPDKSVSRDEGSTSTPATVDDYRRALSLALTQLARLLNDNPSLFMLPQYRSALLLAIDQLESVKMDRDLLELVMRQLESLQRDSRPEGRE